MSLTLSICVLFISLMQSVNGAQYLITIFFYAVRVFGIVIVPHTSIYASLQLPKLDFSIGVLSLI